MKCRRMMLGMLLLAQVASAARVALLIGNSDGGGDLVKLRFVENDLRAVKAALRDHCGFKDQHIITVSDKGPVDVNHALDRLHTVLENGQENLLLLYYSGHADRVYLKMGSRRFPIMEMKKQFSSFPAAIRIGIFDACQSGSFTRLKGGKLAEPFLFNDTGKVKGEVILSSSSATENAQESDIYRSSIFTFHFVNALRGSGDMNGDRKVTLSEAYQYTYNHTVASTARTWGGVQHPRYKFRIQGEGDVVLADLTVGTAGVVLEGSITGDITMFDEENNIVADLKKDAGSRMIIALRPGNYQLIVGKSNDRKWKKSVHVNETGLVSLHLKQFERVDVRPTQRKGVDETGCRMGVSLSGNYGIFHFSSGADNFDRMYAGFKQFGYMPSFITWVKKVYGGIGLRLCMKKVFSCVLEYTHVEHEKNGGYSGSYSPDFDARTYQTELRLQEKLYWATMRFGVAYRFNRYLLRGVEVEVGFHLNRVTHTLNAVFTDELFDLPLNNEYTNSGSLVVPYAGIGYTYQIHPRLDISMNGRYRCQAKPLKLNTTDPYSMKYDFGGFELSGAVTFFVLMTRRGE
jgi:hypothetical protein